MHTCIIISNHVLQQQKIVQNIRKHFFSSFLHESASTSFPSHILVNIEVCLTFSTKYFTLIEYAKMKSLFFHFFFQRMRCGVHIYSIVHSIVRWFVRDSLIKYVFPRNFIVNSFTHTHNHNHTYKKGHTAYFGYDSITLKSNSAENYLKNRELQICFDYACDHLVGIYIYLVFVLIYFVYFHTFWW